MLTQASKRFLPIIAIIISLTAAAFASDFDDVDPEITDRVARISEIDGEVQIRRAGTDTWEVATINLPVVEGDEIAAGEYARYEIQFGAKTHLRASGLSYLRITGLSYEGIALSLSQGKMSVRLLEFDPDATFFEIDAPRTTVALQSAGRYTVDAGLPGSTEVSIAAAEDGTARIYSLNAGFTLRSGRMARVITEGTYAGEWDIDSMSLTDEFDQWVYRREQLIEDRLADAHYDTYYDRDIYGAEDLNAYGDWVHTRDYGYVWRPSRSAISSYADWSPYRYGHWRWIPPYGWTWINDEPWGWATYHHGRWIWHNGYWHWSPYGYYRTSRSWWRPALVVLNIWSNNVCWYPLPYGYRYYDYNRHHYGRRRDRRDRDRPRGGNPTPPPTQQPTPGPTPDNTARRRRNETPPLQTVPPTGVVTVAKEDFGTGRSPIKRPPLSFAKEVLAKVPDVQQSPPILPERGDIESKIGREIKVERPVISKASIDSKIGAAPRQPEEPLDSKLRNTRMFGNRPPLVSQPPSNVETPVTVTAPRRTGAVERKPSPPSNPPVETPGINPGNRDRRPAPVERKPDVRPPVDRTPRSSPPMVERPQRREEPSKPVEPSRPRPSEPPMRRSEPRESPRTVEQPRRSEPPVSKPEPSRPAPPKSEPQKPSPPPQSKGKDG